MSASQQAKSRRRQMRSGYAHLGNAMRRPTIAGKSYLSLGDSIQRNRAQAAREAAARSKKK